MKKILFVIVGALVSIAANSQELHIGQTSPFVAPKYANDVIIDMAPTIDQRHVRLSVAFNGWLYAAFSTVDSINNKGGITIMKSKDDGASWQQIERYSFAGFRYPTFDIVVAGTDTSNLSLYLIGVQNNLSLSEYTLFVDRYNAATNAFTGSLYNSPKGTRRIPDVAIATDYRFPAVGASPYSLAFAYSVYSSTYDSVNFAVSLDGGNTFGAIQNVSTTGSYFRKISLAYGRSSSASNGRYFMAWELLTSYSNRTGHIFESRNASIINGSWIKPINLDSVSTSMINLCRNPSIAVQYNDLDNDSSSCTAIVLVERDYNGDGSDYDLLGFYNKRSHYTNYWFRLDIVNSGENDMSPDITYDPGFNNFLAVYFDSTNKKLPYIVNPMNLLTPGTWITITAQYNDSPDLTAPCPQVEINPLVNQTAHVWIEDGIGTNGVAMFDAEYSALGIAGETGNEDDMLYPNPASGEVNLMISGVSSPGSIINIFDVTGKLVESRQVVNKKAGNSFEKFDVSNWENGLYFIVVPSGNKVQTHKLVVSH